MIIIQVVPEQMVMLEKTQYELNGLDGLLKQLTEINDFNPSIEMYKTLLHERQEKYVELELIKSELMRAYVAPELENDQSFTCDFDFLRSRIFVEVEQGAGSYA
ncbi:MAG: hypothetical protein LBB94_10070 [Clostridiales bacterium]|jgi:hypothetical protein|nr:hypothetical protein [Clostridiales bacterium]